MGSCALVESACSAHTATVVSRPVRPAFVSTAPVRPAPARCDRLRAASSTRDAFLLCRAERQTSSRMKLWGQEHVYKHPWEQVSLASWRKYPHPGSSHVVRADVLSQHVDSEG